MPLLTAVCHRGEDSAPEVGKCAVNALHHLVKIGLETESKECIRQLGDCFDLCKQLLLNKVVG